MRPTRGPHDLLYEPLIVSQTELALAASGLWPRYPPRRPPHPHPTTQLFRSEAFKGLLQKILGDASVVASRREARRFRPGLDYTLATPGAPWVWKKRGEENGGSGSDRNVVDGKGGVDPEGGAVEAAEKGEGPQEEFMVLDAVLCFVDDREPYKEAAWRQDEVGGYVTYLGGEEDEEDEDQKGSDRDSKEDGATASPAAAASAAGGGGGGAGDGADPQKNDAAVYKADEGGSLISVSAASNALSLVLRDDAGITSFVKYVSSAAPGSRFDVVGEYLVACTGDDDDDGSSSSSEGGVGVPAGVLETVPEGESEEEGGDEKAGAEEEEEEPTRKKMKPSNGGV